MLSHITKTLGHECLSLGLVTPPGSTAIFGAPSALATKAMRWRNLSPSFASAFLSADLDLTPEVREDHAAYIGSWLKALQKRQARDISAPLRNAATRGGLSAWVAEKIRDPRSPPPAQADAGLRREGVSWQRPDTLRCRWIRPLV